MVAYPEHGTLLFDAWPHCGSPVSFHEGDYARRRFPIDAPRITLCPRCGEDFRRHAAPPADADVVKFEHGLIETMAEAWSSLVPNQTIYGIAFFDGLFTFLRFPDVQWRSIRTTNAIERQHEEFRRRIKTQCVLPCADTACMLFWALLASGQITLCKVDGWQSLHEQPRELDLAA